MCLVILVHRSALEAGWRSDDGALLAAAALFSPWQYFFVPSVTSLVSASSHVTPWNVFVYDINLMLFGLSAQGHYAHSLLSLWISAMLLYVCAELWMARFWAIAVATLYAISPPAVEVVQQLMAGHYLEGIIFSLTAIILLFHSHRHPAGMRFAVLAALFYGLSTTCKEVYVPLVCLMPWIAPTETALRKRVLHTLPTIVVAIGYVGWRYAVLGRFLGGYAEATVPTLHQVVHAFTETSALLFGNHVYGFAAASLALTCIGMGLFFKGSRQPVLLCLFALLLPLLPLITYPGIGLRHLLVPWTAFCVLSGFVASTATRAWPSVAKNTGIWGLVVLVLVSLMQTLSQTTLIRNASRPMEIQSKFVLQRDESELAYILPYSNSGSPGYQDICLSGLAYSARVLTGHPNMLPKILSHPLQLQLAVNNGKSIFGYDPTCRCVRIMSSSEIEGYLRTLGGPFVTSSNRLAFGYRWDTTNNNLRLEIHPLLEGAYFIRLETILGNSVVFPITGRRSVIPPNSDLHIYQSHFEIWYLDAQQRLIATPSLSFSNAADQLVNWDSQQSAPNQLN